MKYKAVIFDFNGTLFYDTPFHNIAWQRVIKEITGRDLDDEELRCTEKIIRKFCIVSKKI